MPDQPVLSLQDITVRFDGNLAVDGVDLTVQPGEVVGIIGPNGAGKTTLLNAVSGFVPLERGRVELEGRAITRMLPYRRARLGLARSFQDARLFPTLTVREALLGALHPSIASGFFAEGLRLPAAGRDEAAAAEALESILELVDVRGYLDHRLADLSFGTTRAVEMAWLAARRPRVLLLDEPASGLQQSEVRSLGAIIDRVRGDAAAVVIDHDVPFVTGLADRLVAMDLGGVVATGAPDAVLADPLVVSSYLGTGAYSGTSR